MAPPRQVILFFFFAGVGFLALYHPLFHNSTHVPGAFLTDYYHFHWSFWWVRHALTTPGLSVYETNYVMYPYTNNLAFHTMAVFWFPLWAVLEPLVGSLAAVNWMSLTALTLTGYLFFHLLRREGVPRELALTGAVALEVSPLMLRAIWWTNPNLTGVFWFPALILLWGKVIQYAAHRWRGWLAAGTMGLALWAAVLSDVQYVMFVPFLLLPYALLTFIHASGWRGRLRRAALGVFALGLAVLLLWFVGPLQAILTYDESDVLRADLANTWGIHFPDGYFWNASDYYANPRVGGVATLALLAAAVVSLIPATRRHMDHPRRWFWFALMLLPLMLSPGATISLDIPMPYRIYHRLMGGLFRFPERFGTPFMITAFIFAGMTFAPLVKNLGKARIWLGAGLLLMVFANLRTLHPMDVQLPLPPYDFYTMMGDEPYDYVVIEVPVAAGSAIHWVGEAEHQAFQYYGATHGKRMINGHLTRVPTSHWWYLRTDHATLSWLGQRRMLEPELVEPQLAQMIADYPVGYIVIHQDAVGRTRGANEEIIGYFNGLDRLLCAPLVERDAVVYRTRWHPDGCATTRTPPQVQPGVYQIDIGSAGDEVFLGVGWHYPEQVFDISLRWAGNAPQTDLYLEVPAADYNLSLAMQSFHEARNLTVFANGIPLNDDPVQVEPDVLQEFSFALPQSVLGDGGSLALSLAYDDPTVPANVMDSADMRPLAVAVDWLRVESAR